MGDPTSMPRAVYLHDLEQKHIRQKGEWFDVAEVSHPALHAALEIISHDRGAGAGHATYAVPAHYAEHVDSYERALATLTPDQLTIACIGDQSDAERVLSTPALRAAGSFLENFFNNFEDDDG